MSASKKNVNKMKPIFNTSEHPHRRLNILNGEWILVSPHRTNRPWQGKVEDIPPSNRPSYDPSCYLCPGNHRSNGVVNQNYNKCFAFTNDFSSLLENTPEGSFNKKNLLVANSEQGICRVISFSPRHDLTLPDLSVMNMLDVVDLWCSEFDSLSKIERIKHIQIFENKGEIMGCSNPHPHGQIWAQNIVPVEVVKETDQQKKYFEQNGKSLLLAYLQLELEDKERMVLENDHFAVVVPFWATWPYETMIISKRHVINMLEFSVEERLALAKILKGLTMKYDKLFQTSFPYSAGIHQAPVNDGEHPEWHWHMHFYPPLLRSAAIKKFMVGYELLANAQRDITPETAAMKLRELH